MSCSLTKSAKGMECTLRIYPYCNMDPKTVVFCHAPSVRKGFSIKSPDWWGAYGCSACHDIVDGRRHVIDVSKEDINAIWLRAIFLTIGDQIDEGRIIIA